MCIRDSGTSVQTSAEPDGAHFDGVRNVAQVSAPCGSSQFVLLVAVPIVRQREVVSTSSAATDGTVPASAAALPVRFRPAESRIAQSQRRVALFHDTHFVQPRPRPTAKASVGNLLNNKKINNSVFVFQLYKILCAMCEMKLKVKIKETAL